MRGVEEGRGGILRAVDEHNLSFISPWVPARHSARGAVPRAIQRANLAGLDVDALNGAAVELAVRRVAPCVVHDPLAVRGPRAGIRQSVAVVAVGHHAVVARADLVERAPEAHGRRVFVATTPRD